MSSGALLKTALNPRHRKKSSRRIFRKYKRKEETSLDFSDNRQQPLNLHSQCGAGRVQHTTVIHEG